MHKRTASEEVTSLHDLSAVDLIEGFRASQFSPSEVLEDVLTHVAAWEPHIQALGDQLADELFAEGSPADLVERYARKLPLSVISELLGLPAADRAKFTAWAGGFTRFTGALGFLAMIPNILAMRRYLERHLATVRRQGGEGLIAEIVRVEKEGGQISPDEIVAALSELKVQRQLWQRK